MEQQHRPKANDRQVGGDHWQAEYQHWDFVGDIGLGYLGGCATKYVFRWRNKNGLVDLEKAIHYVEKMMEVQPARPIMSLRISECLTRFVLQCKPDDGHIIAAIVHGNYKRAAENIQRLIDRHTPA